MVHFTVAISGPIIKQVLHESPPKRTKLALYKHRGALIVILQLAAVIIRLRNQPYPDDIAISY